MIRTGLSPTEVISRLDAAAKRGRLAGYVRTPSGGTEAAGPLFLVRDFGGPFEGELRARLSTAGSGLISFETRLQVRLAWVFLVVMIATVWPGVWLTDSMLRSYFTGYDYKTWMWYLPLTIPTVPWAMIVAVKRSRSRARVEAEAIIAKIAEQIEGTVERAA